MLVKRQKSLGRKGAKSCWKFMYLLGKTVLVLLKLKVVITFKVKGKVTPLKKLMKYPKFHIAFNKLGEE